MFYAGLRGKLPRKIVIEREAFRSGVEFGARNGEMKGQDVARIEAQWNAKKPTEAFEEQRRTDQQYQSKSYLRDDEHRSEPAAPAARSGARSSFLEHGLQIGLRRLQRGRKAEDNARGNTQQKCKTQNV